MRVATEQIDEVPAVEPESRSPRLGGTDVFRGSLVILTALIIGGFILTRGLDVNTDAEDGEVATDSAADETTDDAAAADGGEESQLSGESTTVAPDTTTPAPAAPADVAPDETATTVAPAEVVPDEPVLRPPAEVKVLVLNGAQTQGIAGRGTEALQAASYLTGTPKNATSQRPSAVLYVDGYQAEALAVAAVFGPGLETLVQPVDPANLPIDDTQAAHVIVVIGADQLIPIL